MNEPVAREELAAEIAQLAARSAGGEVIVLGSLPPAGRDLDLLAREPERVRLSRAFDEHGLLRRGSEFVRFAACTAYAVELIEAESYLPPEPLAELFDHACPLDGLSPLSQPAPAHAVLILARLVAEERALSQKRRARLERILGADAEVWEKAREQAAGWRAQDALTVLEAAAYRPAAHGREIISQVRRHPVVRRARDRVRGHRGLLVALSGIDGSGKSLQARLLTETLEELGIETELVWNDLLGNFALDLVGRPAKAALALLGRGGPDPMANYDDVTAAARPKTNGDAALAREMWSAFVTLSNALEQRVLALRKLARHRVVVFDRGPLDLAVRMEVIYGAHAERQRRVVESAAPRPDLAFYLDIPSGLSLQRKQDVWTQAQLEAHSRIYRALAPRFGASELDGRRPPEDIAAELAAAVWRRVG